MGKDNAGSGVGASPSSRTNRPHGYPKSVRLRKRREFLAVQGSGRRFHGKHFLAVVTRARPAGGAGAENRRESGGVRVGITVTTKVGNAVTRNRIKRLVREYVRQSSWLTRPVDVDMVIIAKHSAAHLTTLADVAADLSSMASALDAAYRREARLTASGRGSR